MAVCVNCNGFALTGPLCALCSATVPEDGWSTVQGRLRNFSAQPITTRPSATVAAYSLQGELANRVWDPSEKSFFDTVLHGSDSASEAIWGGRTAMHRTKPKQNFVVVYTRTGNRGINIIGIGNHVGGDNDKYSITFDNGSKVRCERK